MSDPQVQAGSRATWWKPGQSGNPGGKPAGARNRLTGDFLHALAADFGEHGRKAIEDCRRKTPAKYIAVIAQLVPKEVTLTTPLQEATADDLRALLEWLRSQAAGGADNERAGITLEAEPAPALLAIPETAGIP